MSWLHRILGRDGTTQLVVESIHSAVRAVGRPQDLAGRGAYCIVGQTSTIANSTGQGIEIMQFRWVHDTRLCALRTITVSWMTSSSGHAAGLPPTLGLKIARNWTVDGTGGNLVAFTGTGDNAKRTDFGSTSQSSIRFRVATTAALTAGTKVLDTNYFSMVIGSNANANTAWVLTPTIVWQRTSPEEYPITFKQNEGFSLFMVEQDTGGTSEYNMMVEYSEVYGDGWGGL